MIARVATTPRQGKISFTGIPLENKAGRGLVPRPAILLDDLDIDGTAVGLNGELFASAVYAANDLIFI